MVDWEHQVHCQAELSDDRTAQELCGMEYFRYSAIAHASVVLRVHTR